MPGRGLLVGLLVRQSRRVGGRSVHAHVPAVSVEVRAFGPPHATLEHVLAVIERAAAEAAAEARTRWS